MKKTLTKALAIILSAMMMLSVYACAGGTSGTTDDTTKAAGEDTTAENADTTKADDEKQDDDTTKQEDEPAPSVKYQLKAEKIGTLSGKTNLENEFNSRAWLYTNEDGLYGAISADGLKDTGAKFVYLYTGLVDNAYIFSTCDTFSDELNKTGLVDCDGNELIAAEYQNIYTIGGYDSDFIEAQKVADDGMTVEKTIIYCLSEKKVLVETDGEFSQLTYGGYGIFGYSENGEDKYLNSKGETIDEIENVFENGTYQVTTNDKTVVRDASGKELFTYTNTDYELNMWLSESNCYSAVNYDEDFFVLIDENGNKLTDNITTDWAFNAFNGNALLCCSYNDAGDCCYFVCDKSGNKIIDDEFEDGSMNLMTGMIFLWNEDGRIVIISPDGTVAADVKIDEEPDYESEYGIIEKNGKFYSFKDNDFTVSGEDVMSYFSVVDNDHNLIDLFTGNKLVEDFQKINLILRDQDAYVLGTDAVGDFEIYHITFVK